jgi:hypothetical protein
MPQIRELFNSERKLRSILIALILAMSSLFFGAYLYFFSTSGFSRNDFFVFWAAARLLQHGDLQAAYDPATFYHFERSLDDHIQSGLPFVYPPHAALLFMPFAHLSVHAALVVWDLLSLTIYLAGCRQASKELTLPMFAALIAPSTVINLMYGQTGLVTGGLTVLGFSLLKRRPAFSGVMFGLLSIKPQLAALPLLMLLLSGNRKAISAAAVTVVLMVLASFAVFQPDDWSNWLQALTGFSTKFSASSWHNRFGVTVYFTLLSLGANRHAAIAVQAVISLLVIWQVMRVTRRVSGPTAIMTVLIGVFLATPYALIYDLPVVSAVCLMMIAEGNRSDFRGGELFLATAAWYLPLPLLFTDGGNPALAFCVLAGMFAVILRRAETQMPKSPDAAVTAYTV